MHHSYTAYWIGWECIGKKVLETKLFLKTKCYVLSNVLPMQTQPINHGGGPDERKGFGMVDAFDTLAGAQTLAMLAVLCRCIMRAS